MIRLSLQELGLSTVWDETLCYLLTPALASYELERCVGVSAGNEEFQDAVRGHVQDGHTFKGFPIQLVHRNPHRAFNTCLRYREGGRDGGRERERGKEEGREGRGTEGGKREGEIEILSCLF